MKNMTFLESAVTVLNDVGGGPLHFNEITKIATENGYLKSGGKTPEATMGAQIYMHIKNCRKRRMPAMFKRTGRGLFALTAVGRFPGQTRKESKTMNNLGRDTIIDVYVMMHNGATPYGAAKKFNINESVAHEIWRSGGDVGGKLKVKQVLEIKGRLLLCHSYTEIARDYPTTASNIELIAKGKIWSRATGIEGGIGDALTRKVMEYFSKNRPSLGGALSLVSKWEWKGGILKLHFINRHEQLRKDLASDSYSEINKGLNEVFGRYFRISFLNSEKSTEEQNQDDMEVRISKMKVATVDRIYGEMFRGTSAKEAAKMYSTTPEKAQAIFDRGGRKNKKHWTKDACEIHKRGKDGEDPMVIAENYDTSRSGVMKIINEKCWTDATLPSEERRKRGLYNKKKSRRKSKKRRKSQRRANRSTVRVKSPQPAFSKSDTPENGNFWAVKSGFVGVRCVCGELTNLYAESSKFNVKICSDCIIKIESAREQFNLRFS
jgi:hypothetical protein